MYMVYTTSPALEAVLQELWLAQPAEGGWNARCPSCRRRTLLVTLGETGRVRLWCEHGCSYPRIIGMLALSWEQVDATEAYADAS
jgi:hypothetical protein